MYICKKSSVMKFLEICMILFSVLFEYTNSNPDISLLTLVTSYQGPYVYQDVTCAVTVAVGFSNVGPVGDNIAASTTQPNFGLSVVLSNTDLSQAGTVDSLGVNPFQVWINTQDRSKLSQGVRAGGGQLVAMGGEALVTLPKLTCADATHLCAHISIDTLLYNDTNTANNYKCQTITSTKKCNDNHADIWVQELSVPGQVMTAGQYNSLVLAVGVKLSGTRHLKPDPYNLNDHWSVSLYLSENAVLDERNDLKLSGVPASFRSLSNPLLGTTTVYLGGGDLLLPKLGVSPLTQRYCGPGYLFVHVDPGSGNGVVAETNEKNNIQATTMTVLCSGDMWGLSATSVSLGVGQVSLYPSTPHTITLHTAVHNLHSTNYPGGTAAFTLRVYLHNNVLLTQGGTPLELTRVGSLAYPGGTTPLSPIAAGQALALSGVTLSIPANLFTVNVGYTNIIVTIETAQGGGATETITVNNQHATPIDVKSTAIATDLMLQSFAVTPTSVAADGTTSSTLTLSGFITLDSVNPNSFTTKLFWSYDAMWDTGDVDSGVTVTVAGDGSLSAGATVLAQPSDMRLCGSIYAILFVDSAAAIEEKDETNNRAFSRLTLRCAANDMLSLQNFALVEPRPTLSRGQTTVLVFEAVVACTAADCSSKVAGSDNFDFELQLATGLGVSGNEALLAGAGNFTAADGGLGIQSDISTASAKVAMQVDAAITSAHCSEPYMFLRLLITPADSFTQNSWLQLAVNIDCSGQGSLDLKAASLTGLSAIQAGVPAPFTATVRLIAKGGLVLPRLGWPHGSIRLYVSLNAAIDPKTDRELPFDIPACWRSTLGVEVTSNLRNKLFATDKDGLRMPLTGFEEFCGQPVYVGFVFDSTNQFHEYRENNNIAVTSSPINITGMTCGGLTNSQTLMAKFGNINMPAMLYPYSAYSFRVEVEVLNAHTSPLTGGSAGNHDFGLTVYLSPDGTTSHLDALTLTTTVEAGSIPKLYAGLNPGASVIVKTTVAMTMLTLDQCNRLTKGSPQLLVVPTNVRVASGLTASSSPGSHAVGLLCQHTLQPEITWHSLPSPMWQDFTYTVNVNFTIKHNGDNAVLSQGVDNFAVRVELVNSDALASTVVSWSVTLTDPMVTKQAIAPGNSISASVQAVGLLPSAECSAISSSPYLRVVIQPSAAVVQRGYTDGIHSINLTNSTIDCTNNYIDLSVKSIMLLDTNNNAVDSLPIASNQKFRLKTQIKLGGTTGVTQFTAGGGNNYIYKFYLSHDPLELQYAIAYTPTNVKLRELVTADRTHRMNGNNLNIPSSANHMCGVIYLIVVVVDERNKNTPAPTTKSVLQYVAEYATKDPQVQNNFGSIRVTLQCPGDGLGMVFTPKTTEVLRGSGAVFTFSSTAINSQPQGYPIPTPPPLLPILTFKLMNGVNEVALTKINVQTSDTYKLTKSLAAGETLSLTDVTLTFDIDSTLCAAINANSVKLVLIPGVGAPPGFVDYYVPSNNEVTLNNLACTEGSYDLKPASITQTQTVIPTGNNLQIDFVITIVVDPQATPSAAPAIAVRLILMKDAAVAGDTLTLPLVEQGSATKAAQSPTVTLYTTTQRAELTEAQWESWCGYVDVMLTVDPAGLLLETDETNNNFSYTFLISSCTKDLYDVHMSVSVPPLVIPGMLLPVIFSSKIYNVQGTDIAVAGVGLKNFEFKVYAQNSSALYALSAIDVTPVWYYTGTEANVLTQAHPKHTSKTLNKVYGQVTIPKSLCERSLSHLIIVLVPQHATITTSSQPYSECTTNNNYKATALSCTNPGFVDLSIHEVRSRRPTLKVGGSGDLMLDQNNTVHVQALLQADNVWLTNHTSDIEFDLKIQLTATSGMSKEIPAFFNRAVVKKGTKLPTVLNLGASLDISSREFLQFCGTSNQLQLELDASDELNEADEKNNIAIISGVTVTGAACSNSLDLELRGVFIAPGHEHSIFASSQDVNISAEYAIVKGAPGPANPTSFKYRAALSLSPSWNSSSIQELTNGEQTHLTASGTTLQIVTRISVFISEDPTFALNQKYCGLPVYIGVWINSDKAITELTSNNNIKWTPATFHCSLISDLALSDLTFASSSPVQTITAGNNAVYLDLSVLNRGIAIPDAVPGYRLFDFKLFLSPTPDLLGQQMVVTWSHPELRAKAILENAVTHLNNVSAEFTLPQPKCPDKLYLCVEIVPGLGLPPTWSDMYSGDNFFCIDVAGPKAIGFLDCGRDVGVSGVSVSFDTASKLYPDITTKTKVNVTFSLQGQAFYPTSVPSLGVEFVVSDNPNPTPTGVLSGVNNVLSIKESLAWDAASLSILQGSMVGGNRYSVSGVVDALLAGAVCDALGSSVPYVCLRYSSLTPFTDTKPTNDFVCVPGTTYMNCLNNTLDLSAVLLDFGPNVVVPGPGKEADFDLLVRADVNGTESMQASFGIAFYLSLDSKLTPTDLKLSYKGYKYGESAQAMRRSLSPGTSMLNVGGVPLTLPANLPPEYCTNVHIFAVIDEENKVDEVHKHNNIVSTVIIIACIGDVFMLSDLEMHFPQPLHFGGSSPFEFSVTVHNMKDPSVDFHGTSSNYQLQVMLILDAGPPIKIAESMIYPPQYYHSIPAQHSLRLQHVATRMHFPKFTVDNCLKAKFIAVELLPGPGITDPIANQMTKIPIYASQKICHDATSDIQLSFDSFYLPSAISVPSDVAVSLDITGQVGSSAPSVKPHDFLINLYISRDNRLDMDIDWLWKVVKLPDAFVFISNLITHSSLGNTYGLPTPNDLSYCGSVWIFAKLDADNDISEPDETNHIKSVHTVLHCANDLLAISDVALITDNKEMIEGIQTQFSLRANVTCTKPGCNMTNGVENVKFLIKSDALSPVTLTTIDSLWASSNTIKPGLGASFLHQDKARAFEAIGTITLPANVCPVNGVVTLNVEVNVGASQRSQRDSVLDNNKYPLRIKCRKTVGHDLAVSSFTLLRGKHIPTGGWSMVSTTLTLHGGSILDAAHHPQARHVTLRAFLSTDPHLSWDDLDLKYQPSSCIRNMLTAGMATDTSIVLHDFTGVYLPEGFCGPHYVIMQVLTEGVFSDTALHNNLKATPIMLTCHLDVLGVSDIKWQNQRTIWQDIESTMSVEMTIKNTGQSDLKPCDAPCMLFSPLAALSSDTAYDPLKDTSITVIQLPDDMQSPGAWLPKGSILPLGPMKLNLTITAAQCTSPLYLLVGALLSPNVPLTENHIQNNYRALPITRLCQSVADLVVTNFNSPGNNPGVADPGGFLPLTASLTLQGITGFFRYRYWISRDAYLNEHKDFAIAFKQSTSVPANPLSTTLTIPSTMNRHFCGHSHIILQLDLEDGMEVTEDNNVMAVPVQFNCPESDAFELSSVEVRNLPKWVWPGQQVFAQLIVGVTCLLATSCPVAASSSTLAFPVHFILKFKVFDMDGIELSGLSMADVDASLISALDANTDPRQWVVPATALQANFMTATDNTVAVNLSLPLMYTDVAQCERVHTLGVLVAPGDSDQVANLTWGLLDNDVFTVPLSLTCIENAVDLSVSVFALGGQSSTYSLTMSNTAAVVMSLTVISTTGYWPEASQNNPAFGVAFFITGDLLDPAKREYIDYTLPLSSFNALVSVPSNPASGVALNDAQFPIPQSVFWRHCGSSVHLGVVVDVYNEVKELDKNNNVKTVQVSVSGCIDGVDLSISSLSVSPLTSSGATLPFSLSLLAAAFGERTLNFNTSALLHAVITQPGDSHRITLELHVSPEVQMMLTSSANGNSHTTNTTVVTGSIKMPAAISACDKTWVLEISLQPGAIPDMYNNNNQLWKNVWIQCPDDNLALLSVDVGPLPSPWWPTLAVDITVILNVTNRGTRLVASNAGHFSVKVYFSVDDKLDVGDTAVPAQIAGTDYKFTGAIAADGNTITTPMLTANVKIPDVSTCDAALQSTGKPSLFVELVPNQAIAAFTANDHLPIVISKTSIICQQAQVDLIMTTFKLDAPGGNLVTGVATRYTLVLNVLKTPTGIIAESSSDPQDRSIKLEIFLSPDAVLSSDDILVPLASNSAQINLLRRGIPAVIANPYAMILNSDNLMVDLVQHWAWRRFCGRGFLIARVTDMKNAPSIDPNMSNNVKSSAINIMCTGDTLELTDIGIKALPPQLVIYSALDVVVDFSATICYHGAGVPKSPDRRENFHLKAYMSEDAELNLLLDTEVRIVNMNPHIRYNLRDTMSKDSCVHLHGPITIYIRHSACTSPYLFFAVYPGVQITDKDNVLENNVKFINISHQLQCDVKYVDFKTETFLLPAGNNLTPGEKIDFFLNASIVLEGIASINCTVSPLFKFQFFVSSNSTRDPSDRDMQFSGKDQMEFLKDMFTTTNTINLTSVTEKLHIPEDLKGLHCGNMYLLVVLDVDDQWTEWNEYNNVGAIPVLISCPYDQLQAADIAVELSAVYANSPVPVRITDLNVYNLISRPLLPKVHVLIKYKEDSVGIDVTPTDWTIEEGPQLGTAIGPNQNVTFKRVYGSIDMSAVCGSVADLGSLGVYNGRNLLQVVVWGDQGTDCVQNNIYTTEITVDCSMDLFDLIPRPQPADFALLGGSTLSWGYNPFVFNVQAHAQGVSVGYSAVTGPIPHFTLKWLVGVISPGIDLSDTVPYQLPSTTVANINLDTHATRTINMSDADSGLFLKAADYLFLCTHSGSIWLSVEVDSGHIVPELNEDNNIAKLTGLQLDPSSCPPGFDISMEEFEVENHILDIVKPETPLTFKFETVITVTSQTNMSSLTGNALHFNFSFVLSEDDQYDEMVDLVFEPQYLESGQKSSLRAALPGNASTVLKVQGSNLVVPLTKRSLPYCWGSVFLGVFANPSDTVLEITSSNNAQFYELILDCGDYLDECALNLYNCSEHAFCTNQQYNLTSYSVQPYTCTCNSGFIGDGSFCQDLDECAANAALCTDVPHAVCHNLAGSYECRCATGFTRKSLSGGKFQCDNVNECLTPAVVNCNANATCVDTVGSYACICKPGYSGDGVQNCTDINICSNSTCSGHGQCMKDLFSPQLSCICDTSYIGPTCNISNGVWGLWGAWSDCMAECNPGIRARSRRCDSPAPTNGGQPCARDLGIDREQDACSIRVCESGHVPWCSYNPCFTQVGGVCLYQNKGTNYTCECKPGYYKAKDIDGNFLRCVDLNECNATDTNGYRLHNCPPASHCVNTPASFTCVCDTGYTGSAHNCTDIDECSIAPSVCPPHTVCTNTMGSYSCQCQPGYKQQSTSPLKCLEKRLYDYGTASGDTLVLTYGSTNSTLTQELASPLIPVPHGLPLGNGLLANSIYASENGLIVATQTTMDHSRKETFPYPHPLVQHLSNQLDQNIIALICPFWADAKVDVTFHKLWYKVYTDPLDPIFPFVERLLEDGIGLNMSAKFVFKATWEQVAPKYASSPTERNTFQALVATDYTQSATAFLYEDEGMNWQPTAYNTTDLQLIYFGYPARIGTLIKTPSGVSQVWEDSNSGAWSVFKDRPNAYRVSQKSLMPPNPHNGMLVRKLGIPTTGYTNPRYICHKWLQSEPAVETWAGELLAECAPAEAQAAIHPRYAPLQNMPADRHCYNTPVASSNGGVMQCCYQALTGALIDVFDLSLPYEHQGLLQKIMVAGVPVSESIAFKKCCQESPYQYCASYQQKRPLLNSTGYTAPKMGFVGGNVHIFTLDGYMYPHSGYGEYVLLRTRSTSALAATMIQIRTTLVPGGQAARVAAVAARVGSSSTLQVYLSGDGTSMEVWADGQVWQSGMSLQGAAVSEHVADGVVFSFYSGISVKIALRDAAMSATVYALDNTAWHGQFEGLLGNADGNRGNDLTKPSGHRVIIGSATPQDIFAFAEQWSLRMVYGAIHANTYTLFHHYTTPTSANEYFTVGYTPLLPSPADYSTTQRTACTVAPAAPSVPCMHDYLLTGSAAWASNTLNITTDFNSKKTELGRLPPVFTAATVRNVLAIPGKGVLVSMETYTRTADVLQLTLRVQTKQGIQEVSLAETSQRSDHFTASHTWTPSSDFIRLELLATNSYGSISLFTPLVTLCTCQHGAYCNFDVKQYISAGHAEPACHCDPGWTGKHCENEFNGCEIRHCFAACTDLTASQINAAGSAWEFTCTACPQRLEGNGRYCTDVNECILPSGDPRKNNCRQKCENRAGTYKCSCLNGFNLNDDGRTCTDISECLHATTNNCTTSHGTCIDYPLGGYTCACETGFVRAADTSCTDINECSVNNGGCNRLCVNTIGSFYCECGYGYNLQSGNLCVSKDTCASGLCEQSCTNTTAWYHCSCASNYQILPNGVSCSPRELCTTDIGCDPRLGTCGIVFTKPTCLCPSGYDVNIADKTCIDVNECIIGTAQCGTNSQCGNLEGGYKCSCLTGFRDRGFNTHECININECTEGTHGCTQYCVDTPGSYHCSCLPGYALLSDGKTCHDHNECAPGTSNGCASQAQCINVPGSYRCICPTGFTGTGFQCDDLNECSLDNGGCNGDCHNTVGSFRCSCAVGFMISPIDPLLCLDLNECVSPVTQCSQRCENVVGSYTCTCLPGFTVSTSDPRACNAMNPCSRDCGEGVCAVVNGQITCVCNLGFKQDNVGFCIDFNECTAPRPSTLAPSTTPGPVTDNATITVETTLGESMATSVPAPATTGDGLVLQTRQMCSGPGATCTNKFGSYTCGCTGGYKLAADGFLCVDINECVTADPTKRHQCDPISSMCVNTIGGYTCDCRPGFTTIYGQNLKCADIDECDQNVEATIFNGTVCDPLHARCLNFPGYYRCECSAGYTGSGHTCQDQNECYHPSLNNCGASQVCLNTIGSFRCECRLGFKLNIESNTCVDINECASPVIETCSHICENTVGSFRCKCPEGFDLDPVLGRNCILISPCTTDMQTKCAQQCVKRGGIDYCECRKGYRRQGQLCNDINECALKTALCDSHSWCNNTVAAYRCICYTHYIPDADGLGCSQSPGNWGPWEPWSGCTRFCHGRRERVRTCNQPPPTRGFQCPVGPDTYVQCNYGMTKCKARAWEAKQSIFLSLGDIKPELWESIEPSLLRGGCKGLNAFCTKDVAHYETCCKKPPITDSPSLWRAPFCEVGNLRLGIGYPRNKNTGSKVMLFTVVPRINQLCGELAPATQLPAGNSSAATIGRRRRAVGSSPPTDTYIVPQTLLHTAFNSEEVGTHINKAMKEDQVTLNYTYTVSRGYNEDAPPTGVPPVEVKDYSHIVTITLAVFFTVLGLFLLGAGVFFMLRSPYKVSSSRITLLGGDPILAAGGGECWQEDEENRKDRIIKQALDEDIKSPPPPSPPIPEDDRDPELEALVDGRTPSPDVPIELDQLKQGATPTDGVKSRASSPGNKKPSRPASAVSQLKQEEINDPRGQTPTEPSESKV